MTDAVSIDEAQVAAYLGQHPEFFERHPELLINLALPNPHGESAVSLAERQMVRLRERNAQLQDKLNEMILFGEDNDAISARVHQLSLALMNVTDYPTVLAVLFVAMQESFEVPYVTLRLWNTSVTGPEPVFEPVSEALRLGVADMNVPVCGCTAGEEVLGWFEVDQRSHVRSTAQVALRAGGQCVGLLVMGSPDEERFFPEMGTVYVSRIGDLLTHALMRHLG